MSLYKKYLQDNIGTIRAGKNSKKKFWSIIWDQPTVQAIANAIRNEFMKRTIMFVSMGESSKEIGFWTVKFARLAEKTAVQNNTTDAKKIIREFWKEAYSVSELR